MKRDKKGRFATDLKKVRPHFNQRYKTVKEVNELVEDAFREGFETARRVPKTFGVNQCLEGFKSLL